MTKREIFGRDAQHKYYMIKISGVSIWWSSRNAYKDTDRFIVVTPDGKQIYASEYFDGAVPALVGYIGGYRSLTSSQKNAILKKGIEVGEKREIKALFEEWEAHK
jgi:hypothetical protein